MSAIWKGTMRVTKIFTFDSAHRLSDYNGKCFNLHGHTYKLEVTLEGNALDKLGMVIDFGVLKDKVNGVIDGFFDHKTILKRSDPLNLKLVSGCEELAGSFYMTDYNPTAENMAKDIYNRLKLDFNGEIRVVKVKLYETPTSFVEYKNE